jgi:hypothetical protein
VVAVERFEKEVAVVVQFAPPLMAGAARVLLEHSNLGPLRVVVGVVHRARMTRLVL